MRKTIFVLATVAASAWLLWLVDDGLQLGWAPIVLSNWQEFGLLALHGSLTDNPGGFEATTHPHIYFGMSPWYLYPVYFCTQAFGWTGLGALPFHILLTLLVFWGIWSLTGKNAPAMIVAALVILTPGYGRWQKILDPNAVSVLWGFPYAAVVTQLLKRPKLGFQECALLVVLTVMFVPLNWTTAWFLAPFGVFLLCHPEVRRRPALGYLTLTAMGAVLFVGWSMHAKHSVSAALSDGQPYHGFLGGYTWGNYGYYEGLSTVRFFTRLIFVNAVGLLPLIVWWVWKTASCTLSTPRRGCLSLLPLFMALLVPAVMRNYFCHHPWMGSPVIIAGLVLSLALQVVREEPESVPASLKWGTAVAAGAFIYGLAVLAVFRANANDGLSLIRLVHNKVPRTEGLAVVSTLDPATAALSKILDSNLDRHVVVVETLNDIPHDMPYAILSSRPINDLPLLGQTGADSNGGVAAKAADWFNHTISHRQPGDKPDFLAHYYLYRPAS